MTWMDGDLLGFDLESTGPLPMEALPVSFALIAYRSREVVGRRVGLIDPGCEIPAEAEAIHHISTETARARGGSLDKSIDGIAAHINDAVGRGAALVGCNLVYDLTVINECYKRLHSGFPLFDENWQGAVVDILVLDRHCDRFRKGSRKLSALCSHYGVPLGDAHNAGADAEASVGVAFKIADKYPEIGKANIGVLHVLEKKWRSDWATEFSEYRVKRGEPPLSEEEQDWPVQGVRSVPL